MEIQSSIRRYNVEFAISPSEVLMTAGQVPGAITVIDAKVQELYESEVTKFIEGPLISIDAVEMNKTYERCAVFLEQILKAGIRKDSHLLVVGGGIVQDIGAFMASILFRGIEYTLIPTTMLAQSDSCIGSKTSLNIGNFKNQLGTFYPPARVLISSGFLNTLGEADLNSGICEALKLAMIAGPEKVKAMSEDLGSRTDPKSLLPVVKLALEIKKEFIELDEFDKGPRNLLNFGHTFGHAIESESGYEIAHGQAVGIGIVAAFYFSWRKGMIPEQTYKEASALLNPWTGDHLFRLREFQARRLVELMKRDKKSSNTGLGFILTRGFGKMERQTIPAAESETLLSDWLKSI